MENKYLNAVQVKGQTKGPKWLYPYEEQIKICSTVTGKWVRISVITEFADFHANEGDWVVRLTSGELKVVRDADFRKSWSKFIDPVFYDGC